MIHNGKCHNDTTKEKRASVPSAKYCSPNQISFAHDLISGSSIPGQSSKIIDSLGRLKSSVPILRRVPRGARNAMAEALIEILQKIVTSNNMEH